MDLADELMLVTGGAGFIGSSLVQELLQMRATVRVLDNFVNGQRQNLEQFKGCGSLEIVEGDVRDKEILAEVCKGVSVVFHLACLGVRHSIHSPEENHDVNALGTLRILEVSRNMGVRRFVYVSSSEVYGTAQWVPMDENHPTFPCTVYGGAKLAGEAYTRAYHRTYGFPIVIVRPFNAYGPRCHHEGDSGEVIPKFVLRALAGQPLTIFGDGTQTRDFTYVTDTARGMVLAASSDEALGRTLNLGSGSEVSIRDLADIVLRISGRKNLTPHCIEPRPGDVLRLYADSTLATDLLGFRPTVPLEDGIQQLIAWYQSCEYEPEELLREEQVQNWLPVSG